MNKFFNFFYKLNTTLSIFLFAFLIISFSLIYYNVLELLKIFVDLDNLRFYESDIELIFFAIIFAPIFETLIFQTLLYKLLGKFPYKITIIVSASLFSIVHFPKNESFYEIVDVFFAGLVFATAYYIYKIKNVSATKNVILIHALCNTISILSFFILRHYNYL